MKTIYLIWKDLSCNGVSPNWQEITGKEFLTLVRSLEGKHRYFIKLPSTNNDCGDCSIVLEANQANYLNWKREKNHADYIKNGGKDILLISYHALESEDGESFGEELLPNPDSDVETQYINTLLFEAALTSLTDEEYRLIEFLYLSEKPGTVRAYEELTGISKSTVNRRQKATVEKLKKLFTD